MFIKKFLKSGFFPFIAGVAMIIAYVFISPWKIGPDSSPYPMSVFNVLFSVIFLSLCCFAAFMYGKRKNKSGLIGLTAIWALFYIAILLSLIPFVSRLILLPAYIILFCYWTLFLIINLFVLYAAPAVMIILMICFWYIGKNTGGHI